MEKNRQYLTRTQTNNSVLQQNFIVLLKGDLLYF